MLLTNLGIPGQMGPAERAAPSPAMQADAGDGEPMKVQWGVSHALSGGNEVSGEPTGIFEADHSEGLAFPRETAPVFSSEPGWPVQPVGVHSGQEALASVAEESGFIQVLSSDIPVSAPPAIPETGEVKLHRPDVAERPQEEPQILGRTTSYPAESQTLMAASEESLPAEGHREKMPYTARLAGRNPLSQIETKEGPEESGDIPGGTGTPEAVFLAPPPEAHQVEEVFHLDRPGEIARFLREKSRESLPKTVELRVEPAGFGRLKVLLSQRGEEVTVKFVAPSYDARRILESSAGELQRALNRHGLMLAGFGVDGREQPSPDNPGRNRPDKTWPAGDRSFSGIAGGHKLKFPTLSSGVFDYLA